MDFLNPRFWLFVAVIAGIYAIMALGLYVQFSLAGLPNFGHVAFMAVAAYAMAILVVRLEAPLLAGGCSAASWRRSLLACHRRHSLAAPARRLPRHRHRRRRARSSATSRMNLPDMTGGPIGSIGMLGPGQIAMYNGGMASVSRPD